MHSISSATFAAPDAAAPDPGEPDLAALSAAVASLEAGRYDDTERHLESVLSHPVTRPDGLHLLGLVALERGEPEVARRHLRAAVESDPDNLERALDLGRLELETGACDDAVVTLTSLSERTGGAAVVELTLGRALSRAGRHDEAIAAHERVVTAAPGDASCWSDLASAYLAAGKIESALEGFRHASSLAPDEPELHYNVGTAELLAQHYAAARAAFEACLRLESKHARARMNLGVALKALGEPELALSEQRRALEDSGGDPECEWNLGLTEIYLGHYEDGFRHYEARAALPGYPALPGAAWDGSPRPDRTLVLHAEQGLGDTLMFLRFVPGARARVGRVVLVVAPRLVRLLEEGIERAGGGCVDEVCAQGEDKRWPEGALHARLPSLPHLLEVGSAFEVEDPYLGVGSRDHEALADVRGAGGLRVGLAWQGNPTYRADAQRSLPLEVLRPLGDVPDVRLFSLQKYEGWEQLDALRGEFDVVDLGARLDEDGDAFVDTAAALMELDLLITSDSAIAHLGGALGVEVWLLLAHTPDFRWGPRGERTPWYPSVRLFRQQAPGDWPGVVRDVARALGQRAAEGS